MTVNAIWLDGWKVHSIHQTPDGTVAEASYLPQPDCCPKCGVINRLYRHGSKVIPYRDTPAFGSKVLIRTTLTHPAVHLPGSLLHRWLPSFSVEL